MVRICFVALELECANSQTAFMFSEFVQVTLAFACFSLQQALSFADTTCKGTWNLLWK